LLISNIFFTAEALRTPRVNIFYLPLILKKAGGQEGRQIKRLKPCGQNTNLIIELQGFVLIRKEKLSPRSLRLCGETMP
jgi:hypothetical protein